MQTKTAPGGMHPALTAAVRWALPKLGLYVAAAASGAALFLLWASIYTIVNPDGPILDAPAQQNPIDQRIPDPPAQEDTKSISSRVPMVLLSPGVLESALSALVPKFAQSSGYRVVVAYGPAGALADRVKNGEAADVAILSAPAADALRKLGKLIAGSETVVAKVGIGVYVHKGDPKPDVSSVDAFLRLLMEAKSISYSDPALGGSAANYVGNLMSSLDITGAIEPKTKLASPAKPLDDHVDGGGPDIGLNQIPEIIADPRLELVGPLPAAIQNYTSYVAAVTAGSSRKEMAIALVKYLASPAASGLLTPNGFEPLN